MPLSTDTQYCFDYITYLQKCIDVKYTFIHIDVTVALSFTFSRQYYYLHYVTIVNTVSFQCEHNMNICLLWLSKWVGLRCSHFLWVEVDGLPLSSCMKDHMPSVQFMLCIVSIHHIHLLLGCQHFRHAKKKTTTTVW